MKRRIIYCFEGKHLSWEAIGSPASRKQREKGSGLAQFNEKGW